MKLTRKIEADILSVYQAFWDSYLSGDFKTMGGFLSDDFTLIGTTEGEVFNNKKAAMKYVKATVDQIAGVMSKKNIEINVTPVDETILVNEFFDGYINADGASSFYGKFRATTVMKQIRGKWKIIHQHGSLPDSKAEVGETLAAESVKKENQELREAVKRRTRELEQKNRDLEIEASLERVRAKAMAMQSSTELADLIGVIHGEISRLDKNLDRSFIMLFDKSGDSTWWMSDDKNLSLKRGYKLPYHKHAPYLACLQGWRRLRVQWTYVLKGAVKKKWDEFIFKESELAQLPKMIKSHMTGAKEVYWSSSFNKYGCISTGSYAPLEDSSFDLMVRFSRMFEQTYTRFLDLQKVEAQAREAQIQLALERVRARTMAMQRSDELRDAANLLYKQVQSLGIPVWTCGYNIWEKNDKYCTGWMSTNDVLQPPFKIPLTESPVFIQFYKSRKRNEDFYVEKVEGKALALHYKYMRSLPVFADIIEERLKSGFKFPKSQINHVANFAHGNLVFITNEPVPDAWDIFKRFAKVFEQTYTRFLDLKKAEAQARGAQIEAALEKIRSRSLAMHSSDELSTVLRVMFDQLEELKVLHGTVGIQLFDFDTKESVFWPKNTLQLVPPKVKYPFDKAMMNADGCHRDLWEAMSTRKTIFNKVYTKKQKDRWFKYIFANNSRDVIFDSSRKFLLQVETFTLCFIPEKKSALYADSFDGTVYTEEEFEVLKRTAKVFEQAYIRFLDLQKAEAQAREAQIETALERVRSTSMGMHHSNELEKVVIMLFDKLSELGLSFDGTLICLPDQAKKNIQFWIATNQLPQPVNIIIPLDKEILNNIIVKDLLSRKDIINKAYSGASKNGYFRYVARHNVFPDSVKKFHLKQKAWTASFAAEKNSAVGVDSWYGQTTSLENFQVVKRFARVFEQAYVRFLDLQKAEAQAREAQIEAALERVRSRSMAMQNSSELTEVASLLFKQVKDLGVDCWTTGFNIWSEDGDSYVDYVTDPTGVWMEPYTVDTTKFHVLGEFAKARKRGETFYVAPMSGEQAKQGYRLLMKFADKGQFDKILESGFQFPASQVNHLVFGAKASLLFITYEPVPEAHDIFKRFGKAFEQTYTRFLDLKNAEAQARESQIQLALERLRARTMAMHNSSELSEAATLVFEQLKQLGVSLWGCGFNICHDEDVERWMSLPNGKMLDPLLIPYASDLSEEKFHEIWKSGIEIFSQASEGEELREGFESLKLRPSTEIIYKRLQEINIPLPTWMMHHIVPYKHGYLWIMVTKPFEETQIFIRFAKVFEQTFTRFLDLQKAEAAAREAQIEAALERVRSRTMAMHKSDELLEVITVVCEQLQHVGLKFGTVSFGKNSRSFDMDFWVAAPDLKTPIKLNAPYRDLSIYKRLKAASREQRHFFTDTFDAEEVMVWYQHLIDHNPAMFSQKSRDYLLSRTAMTRTVVLLKNVFLFLINHDIVNYSDEENQILIRFANVFEQAYTRFLDLQRAEAQAHEAQVEAALEKVRARTMGMQRSDELSDVAVLMFQQVKSFGFELWGCGFNIWDRNEKECMSWMSDPNGQIAPPCKIPLTEMPVFIEFYESRQAGIDFYVDELEGKRLEDNYKYLAALPVVGNGLQDFLRAGGKVPTYQIDHVVNFAYGNLIFISYKQIPEAHDLFKRFGKVFEQTYTRFLDLQKAEAQTRESQIQLALERIRARTMAMQRSEELAEVSQLLYQQFLSLDVKTMTCAFMFVDEERQTQFGWTVLPDGTLLPKVLDFPLTGDPVLDERYKSWKMNKPLHHTFLDAEANRRHHEFLSARVATHISDDIFSRLPEQLNFYNANYLQGYVLIITEKELSDEEQNILVRFARTFEQTYTRFLDLQKAEAQARESQIQLALERVRAKTMAMHKSSEVREVAVAINEQLVQLGFERKGFCSIVLIDKSGDIEWWMGAGYNEERFKQSYFTRNFDHPGHRAMVEAFVKKEKYIRIPMVGEVKRAYDEGLFVNNGFESVPGPAKEWMLSLNAVDFTVAYNKYGGLHYGIDKLTDEQAEILYRFAGVFEQSYTRFLDLQKAEASAREAQIEAALEKIRSRSLAMHHSGELKNVAAVMFEKMKELDVVIGTIAIQLFDQGNKSCVFWPGNNLHNEPPKVKLPFDEKIFKQEGYMKDCWESKMKRENLINKEYTYEQKIKFFDYVLASNDLEAIPEADRDAMRQALINQPHGHVVCLINETNSSLFADSWNGEQYSEDKINVLARAAKVFEQAYVRFLDLQKAEAQARESQIEAALERVRARTMAMHKSEELLEVIVVVSQQLSQLGFRFDVVSFARTSEVHDYKFWFCMEKVEQAFEINVPYLTSPMFERVKAAVARGDRFYADTLTVEENREWITHMLAHDAWPGLTEEIKQFLLNSGYARSIVIMPQIMLLLGNYFLKAYSEEQNNILKRFAAVFEQSYTRFLDLQKAEAQARESQIEAALERVRAKAMAMHAAEQLKEVVHELRHQLGLLELRELETCVIQLNEESPDFIHSWAAVRPPGRATEIKEFFALVPKRGLTIVEEWLAEYASGKKDYVLINEGEKLHQWFDEFMRHHPEAFATLTDSGNINPDDMRSFWSFADFQGGSLLMVTYAEPDETSRSLLRRFANVFGLAYRRFADLKQAEAQAREAQIEVALERVRAKAMAMHVAQQLSEVVHELHRQIGMLGQNDLDTCVIHLNEESPENILSWAAIKVPGGDDDIKLFSSPVPKRGLKIIEEALANYYDGKQEYVLVNEGDKLKEWAEWGGTAVPGAFELLKKSAGDDIASARSFWSFADFQGGSLLMVTLGQPDETSRTLLRRFANVFGLAYRRFADLKQAEAQARESQIEAALERVRASAMAMHSTHELKEVVRELRKQIGSLGDNYLDTVAIHLNDESPDFVRAWAAARLPGRDELKEFHLEYPKQGLPIIEEALKFYHAGKKDYQVVIDGDKLKTWWQYVFHVLPEAHEFYSGTPATDEARSGSMFFADFPGGSLILSSMEQPGQDALSLLRRFSNVFGLAYRRYVDLKQAEAQAREATIEAALEKIRSRSLGMHRSEEIKDVVKILFEKLKELGLVFDGGAAIHLFAEGSKDASILVMAPQLSEPIRNSLPYDEEFADNPIIHDVWQAKESGQHIVNKHYSREEKDRYFKYVFKYNDHLMSHEVKDFIRSADSYTANFISEKNSLLGASSWTKQVFCENDIEVLKRVAHVFEQAYVRFLDLQKAEALAREATIEAALEKIRSRSLGMHRSEEIKDVVTILYEKLKELGLIFDGGAGIHTFLEGGRDAVMWVLGTDHNISVKNNHPYDKEYVHNPVLKDIWKAKDTGEHIINRHYTYEEKNEFFEYISKHNDARRVPTTFRTAVYNAPGYTATFIAERNSLLSADSFTGQTFTASDVEILKRVARVFDQAYVRFLDLQKAELHARDAVRQASLDRVRAEIASMRTVQDLDRITPLIWRELNALGIPFIRCGVFIMDDDTKTIHNFLATPDGKAIAVFDLPYDTPGIIASILKHWHEKKIYQEHWDENALTDLGKVLVSRNVFSSLEQYLATLPTEGFYPYCMPFQQGMLYVGNLTQLKEDELGVLQSLADAFSTAYARYDDFNRLEEAKQRVDNALIELKQTQQQLVQSEKMASLGQLTAGIAHEIQNPLNFVNNFSEVSNELIDEMKSELEAGNIQGAAELAKDIKQNLEKITHHGKRADGIVKGMLQHSRAGSGNKELTDINALCDEFLRLAYHGFRAKDKSFNTKFESHFDESLPKINVMSQDIGRVILNLINNGFYAVSEKSKSISTGYAPILRVCTRSIGDKVEIRVEDNGPGISDAIKDKIFQPFFTTKPTGQGTGLGLSLSYDIIKAHGGTLTMNSKEGEGTEFIVQLPV